LNISFPKNLEEFRDLVDSLDVENPEAWTRATEYRRDDVIEFLFLWSIWQYIEHPAKSSYTQDKIRSSRAWANANPSRQLDPVVPLVEKFLSKGITPEEISQLVMLEQSNLAFGLCYHVDDPNSCTGSMSHKDNGLGLYVEDEAGDPMANSRMTCLHEILMCAKPKNVSA